MSHISMSHVKHMTYVSHVAGVAGGNASLSAEDSAAMKVLGVQLKGLRAHALGISVCVCVCVCVRVCACVCACVPK